MKGSEYTSWSHLANGHNVAGILQPEIARILASDPAEFYTSTNIYVTSIWQKVQIF